MTAIQFIALETTIVDGLQAGGRDANDQAPERSISDGQGNPCRHCLADISKGEPFLICAHRPFPSPQPYAEVGPIFLHAGSCDRYDGGGSVPAIFKDVENILMRGYGADDRIVYGSGQVIPCDAIMTTAGILFARPEIRYIHLRSASNNCYQCRIDRI